MPKKLRLTDKTTFSGMMFLSYKNILRDSYTYGYKSIGDQNSISYFKLISNILQYDLNWTENPKERLFATANTQCMGKNPFQNVYKYSKYTDSYIAHFFHIMAALSTSISLNGKEEIDGIDALNLQDIDKDYWKYRQLIEWYQNSEITRLESYFRSLEIKIKENIECRKYKTITLEEQQALNTELDTLKRKFDQLKESIDNHGWAKKDEVNLESARQHIESLKSNIDFIKSTFKSNENIILVASELEDNISKLEETVNKSFSNPQYIERILDSAQRINAILDCDPNCSCSSVLQRISQIDQLRDAIYNNKPLTADQLMHFFPNSEKKISLSNKDNNTMENHLIRLSNIGLVLSSTNKDSGKTVWSLGKVTWKYLVDMVSQTTPQNSHFEEHLKTAIDFYTRYYALGVVGSFLLDRTSYGDKSSFRFKHEYFIQSLNDFVLVDLLSCMEKEQWCEINYCDGVSGKKSTFLCYPFSIRISAEHGREYLFCFEPFKKNFKCIRLDFIDSIEFFDKEDIFPLIGMSENIFETYKSNAESCENALWEVADSIAPNTDTSTVQLCVSCRPEEYYIWNRMNSELRNKEVRKPVYEETNNSITVKIDVSDPENMIPWIRSFYKRIISCQGLEQASFDLKSDVSSYYTLWCTEDFQKNPSTVEEYTDYSNIPSGVESALDNNRKSKRGNQRQNNVILNHEQIFNKIFSFNYHKYAEIFTNICVNGNISEEDFSKLIQEKIPDDRCENIKNFFLSNGFLKKNKDGCLYSKYKIDDNKATNFYRDIVPLTDLELRWLRTILDSKSDDKICVFLSEAERDSALNILDGMRVQPLPIEKISYYDKQLPTDITVDEDAKRIINRIARSILYQREVILSYKYFSPSEKEMKLIENMSYLPLALIFTKRKNYFQTYMFCINDNRVYPMNLSRIVSIEDGRRQADANLIEKAKASFDKFMASTHKVQIDFYNNPILVDSLLTEFSPWEKECKYDSDKELYHLTIHYHADEFENDKLELVTRLMKYGPAIHIPDKEDPIYMEILSRLKEQLALLPD